MRDLPDRALGWLVGGLIALMRLLPVRVASGLAGAVARTVGPWIGVSRMARKQLRAAFPEKDDAWIEATLKGVWDNLGRVVGEYAQLDHLWDFDPDAVEAGRIVIGPHERMMFERLRDDGQPALCFTAHLGNWELPAIAAARHGLPSAVLYRMPNNPHVAERIRRIREGLMGRLIRSRAVAAFELSAALGRGEHVGMLVDQHFSRGVDVTFFGRTCKANPTLARLARQVDCPVVGVRTIRLPGNRFRLEATEPIELPRDAEGQIDIVAATQRITDIVEGWVREHPDQWLWLHRRWR